MLKNPGLEAFRNLTASVDIFDIADFFIKKGVESKEPLSHMKLQKLLYYAQGWHLALYNKKLFREKFEKWSYGPVVRRLYEKLRNYKGKPIHIGVGKGSDLTSSVATFLERVWKTYGKYTAIQLSDQSHSEDPWIRAEDYKEISDDSLKEYFEYRLLLTEQRTKDGNESRD